MTKIVRFTGDDDPHALLLQVLKLGETIKTPLDLDLIQTIEFAFKKADNTVVVYTCVKDTKSKSGIVYIPFVATDVDVASTQGLDYDVQVIWVANGKKKTLGKDLLILNEDINKT